MEKYEKYQYFWIEKSALTSAMGPMPKLISVAAKSDCIVL